jgi:hypothetical protein
VDLAEIPVDLTKYAMLALASARAVTFWAVSGFVSWAYSFSGDGNVFFLARQGNLVA